MQVQPYLFFDGRCEEAIDFYRQALGAQVDMLMRYRDSPDPPHGGCAAGPRGQGHARAFRIGDSVLMASDGTAAGTPEFKGFSLSLDFDGEAQARRRVRCAGAGRQRGHADGQDVLRVDLRHGHRSLRRAMDGRRDGANDGASPAVPTARTALRV